MSGVGIRLFAEHAENSSVFQNLIFKRRFLSIQLML